MEFELIKSEIAEP